MMLLLLLVRNENRVQRSWGQGKQVVEEETGGGGREEPVGGGAGELPSYVVQVVT